ncbi:MAG TPA: hypothetical protein PLU35_12970 [Phycisphaerales bacterium]|nr:hypothetical protein [Phycisphaerales bacterium]
MSGAPAWRGRWDGRRVVGYAVGLLLLAAAVWAVASQRGAVAGSMDAVRAAPAWMVVVVLLLPMGNWLAASASLRALTLRRGGGGDVGRGEMLALVGSAWLLNYLPMRPGMIGRIAYHKRINGIAVRDSVLVLVEANAMTAGAVGLMLAIALALRAAPAGASWSWLVLALPGAAFAGAWAAGAARGAVWTAWAAAATARYADLMVWLARYACAFALLGRPLTVEGAAVFAAVSQAAFLVPFVGNGLGVREWGIGLVAASWAGADSAREAAAFGLAADLLNRAAEVAVSVPMGIACTAWLGRRVARAGPDAGSGFGDGGDPADDGVRTE